MLAVCTTCQSNNAMPLPPSHLAALPAGVDDITAVVIILLEGNPKDKSWAAAAKLMNNVDKFLERLKGFKAVIDQGLVSCCKTTVRTPSDNKQCHICSATASLFGYVAAHTPSCNTLRAEPLSCARGCDRLSRRQSKPAAATWPCHTLTRRSSATRARLLLDCVNGPSTLSSTMMLFQRWSPNGKSWQLPMPSCTKQTPL
jgi:hypothetical protein